MSTSLKNRTQQLCGFPILLLLASLLPAYAQTVSVDTRLDARSDPPGFGLVSMRAGQTLRLNVFCFDHPVGAVPPNPCRGIVMFHDGAGHELKRSAYELKPGQTAFFPIAPPTDSTRAGFVNIDPCWLPAPGGRAVSTVELIDNQTAQVLLFENPAATRMSEFNNSRSDPGSLVGFNPQPDPPGFGPLSLSRGQIVRLNVACFEHPVNGFPPDPCRGTLMFHDAAGNVVSRGSYDLQPGQSMWIQANWQQVASTSDTAAILAGIVPCVLPQPGGRAVPNVEVFDTNTGNIVRLINPAAARMSQFQ